MLQPNSTPGTQVSHGRPFAAFALLTAVVIHSLSETLLRKKHVVLPLGFAPSRADSFSHAGYSADQAGLLAMMHAFTNWKWYQERAECNDWSERPGAKYCNWDGVSCNAAGQVVTVQFLKNGSFLTGLVPPAAISLHHEQSGPFSTSD